MAVRNESVRLSLIDDFSSNMARAATATALLNKELNSLSGQSVHTARVTQNINRDTDAMAKSAQKADNSINQLTGRLRLMADVAAILGPSLAPIGAVGIAGIAGLANQFGAAAIAGGVALAAFQGVGDALKAVNEAAIEPTAANLEEARAAMAQLSPAAQEMVNRLQELRPVMQGIRDAAAGGLFPGVIEMFDEVETRGDEVERIFRNVAEAAGELAADAGADLASARWTEFFDFLATEVPDTLTTLGHTVGDLTHGMAELWMAFDPLNDDFNGWLRDVAAGFDEWASGLAQTEGFREFIDYVRTTGPQVAETFGALANAVVQIVQAAAPLGGPVLAGIEAVAKALGSIADSDFGGPILAAVGAFALLSRTTKAYQGLAATAFGTRLTSSISGYVDSLTHVTTAQERAQRSAGELQGAQRGMLDGLSRLDKAALAVGGILALDAAIDGLLSSMREAVPGTEEMTSRLLALNDGSAAALGDQFRKLGEDIEFLEQNNDAADGLLDWVPNITGLIPGWENAGEQFERVSEQVATLDESLANLVSSGHAEVAAEALANLGLDESQMDTLLDSMPLYEEALASAANEAKLAGDASSQASGSFGQMGSAAAQAEADLRNLTSAFEQLNGFFNERAALRNYEQALDDFRQGLRETGNTFDVTTQKGRENQTRLDAIATSAIQMAESLEGVERVKFAKGVISELQAMAANLNGPARKAVLNVISELRVLADQKPKPKVDVDTRAALAGVGVVDRDLDKVDKKRPKPIIDAATEAAMNAMRAVRNFLDDLDGTTARTYTIHEVRTVRTATDARGSRSTAGGLTVDEDGGIHERGVRTFADGGWGMDGRYYQRVPQIVPGGANILWAEDITRDEAYISRKAGMEARNIEILNRAASWFGMGIHKQAANGAISAAAVSVPVASAGVSVNITGPITTVDPKAVAREVLNRQRDALALARLA